MKLADRGGQGLEQARRRRRRWCSTPPRCAGCAGRRPPSPRAPGSVLGTPDEAGAAGVGGHTLLVEVEEHGLRFDVVEAEADQAGHPVVGVAVDPDPVELRGAPGMPPISRRCSATCSTMPASGRRRHVRIAAQGGGDATCGSPSRTTAPGSTTASTRPRSRVAHVSTSACPVAGWASRSPRDLAEIYGGRVDLGRSACWAGWRRRSSCRRAPKRISFPPRSVTDCHTPGDRAGLFGPHGVSGRVCGTFAVAKNRALSCMRFSWSSRCRAGWRCGERMADLYVNQPCPGVCANSRWQCATRPRCRQ